MTRISICALSVALLALAACGKNETSPQMEGAKEPPAAMSESAPEIAGDIGEPASAEAPPVLSDTELGVALGVIGMKLEPDGLVMNACDEKVKPDVYAAELGGAVGRAYLIAIGGGPNTATCYGDGPGLWLVKREGASFRLIFQDRYYLAIMPTEHNGVKDIAIGGPGFEFPVYEWNGTQYVFSRNIKDTEMPAPIN